MAESRQPYSGPSVADCRDLSTSWQLALRAERKSKNTQTSYRIGLRKYLEWAEANDADPIVRKSVSAWVADLLDNGAEASTAVIRQTAVRRFSAWLADEEEIDTDPLYGMKSPKLDLKVVEPHTDDELRALLDACKVPRGSEERTTFRGRRDEAILRILIDTGGRAGEVAAIGLDDLDLEDGFATIVRGKGGTGRRVPLGVDTVLAIDRWLRVRKTHRLAASPALWLGDRGKTFGYEGLRRALAGRAELAEVKGFHPHRCRHTFATRWLKAGGTESGLMAVAGWSRSDMLRRYTRHQAEQLAAEEARRLNLGEL